MTPKFSIGERVLIQRTGIPCVGTVFGVVHPQFFIYSTNLSGNHVNPFDTWEKIYPGCIEDLTYYVKYDNPQFANSFEEFGSAFPPETHHNIIMGCYISQRPQIVVSVTERDLLSFDKCASF